MARAAAESRRLKGASLVGAGGLVMAAVALAADWGVDGRLGLDIGPFAALWAGLSLAAVGAWAAKPRAHPRDLFWLWSWIGLAGGAAEAVHMGLRLALSDKMHHLPTQWPWMLPLTYGVAFAAAGAAAALGMRWAPMAPAISRPAAAFPAALLIGWAQVCIYESIHPLAQLALATGLAVVASRCTGEAVLGAARRTTPWLAAAAVAWTATWPLVGAAAERNAIDRLPAAPTPHVNVLLIVLDTVRADHLTPYGYARDTTPNMDSLA